MKESNNNNRRDFLKKCGLSTASLILPVAGLHAMPSLGLQNETPNKPKAPVNFIYDGLAFSPPSALLSRTAILRLTNALKHYSCV